MNEKTKKLFSAAAAAAVLTGVTGFFLRLFLYRVGLDEKGMLVSWHPLTVCLVLAGLLSAGITLTLTWRLPGKSTCRGPAGKLPAVGSALMALGLVLYLLAPRQERPHLAVLALGILAAAAMALSAWTQFRGRQPYFLSYVAVSLFMAANLIGNYQAWRQVTQLMDFAPALLSVVMLMLYAFQLAQGSLAQATRRSLAGYGGMGIFLCLTAASGIEPAALYLGGAAWMITGLLAGPQEEPV